MKTRLYLIITACILAIALCTLQNPYPADTAEHLGYNLGYLVVGPAIYGLIIWSLVMAVRGVARLVKRALR